MSDGHAQAQAADCLGNSPRGAIISHNLQNYTAQGIITPQQFVVFLAPCSARRIEV